MMFERQGEAAVASGLRTSPGGFEFGIQGWQPGEPKPKSITFFLDGSAMVCDQYGHPIRGAVNAAGARVWFATVPPSGGQSGDEERYEQRFTRFENKDVPLATHAQVISVLAEEGVDWNKITSAGWPQLPYSELVKVPKLPPTPVAELAKIRDPKLRNDAIKARNEAIKTRREAEDVVAKELTEAE